MVIPSKTVISFSNGFVSHSDFLFHKNENRSTVVTLVGMASHEMKYIWSVMK